MNKQNPADTPPKSAKPVERGPWIRLPLDRHSFKTDHNFSLELHAKIAASLMTENTFGLETDALILLHRCAEQLRRHKALIEVHASLTARFSLGGSDRRSAARQSLRLLAQCSRRLRLNVSDRAASAELLRETEESGLPPKVNFKKAMQIITGQEKHSQRAEEGFLSFLETHFGILGPEGKNRQYRLHEQEGFDREDVIWLRNRYSADREAGRLKSTSSDKPMRKGWKKVFGGKVAPKS